MRTLSERADAIPSLTVFNLRHSILMSREDSFEEFVGFVTASDVGNRVTGLQEDPRGQVAPLSDLAVDRDVAIARDFAQTAPKLVDRNVDRARDIPRRKFRCRADIQ